MAEARVVLVDDHEMFREALCDALSRQTEFRVVFETRDARALIQRMDQHLEFAVAVIDIALPGPDGIALVRELRRRRSACAVVMLSMHAEPDMIVEAMLAGARGYVCKAQPVAELLHAIRTVLAGRCYLPPIADAQKINDLIARRKTGDDPSPLAALSPREREIFTLLIAGACNAEVARQLCISVKTVETHRSHIFGKFGVHSASELIRFAARHHLLMPCETARFAS